MNKKYGYTEKMYSIGNNKNYGIMSSHQIHDNGYISVFDLKKENK